MSSGNGNSPSKLRKFEQKPQYIIHQLVSNQSEKLVFEPPRFETKATSLMYKIKKNETRRKNDLDSKFDRFV